MCAVSMVYDKYYDKWKDIQPVYPEVSPTGPYTQPWQSPPWVQPLPFPVVPQEEVEDLYDWLKRARQYDKDNNQPDCELEEKKKKLKDLADRLGIKIDFPEGE